MALNTSLILDSLVSFLSTQQYQGSNLYNTVKKGTIVDPTDITSCAGVTFSTGVTKRYDSGWQLMDTPAILIESILDQTDATAAETLLCNIRDLLIPLFMARYQLNSIPNVVVTLLDVPDKAGYKYFPNGRWYRVHQMFVKAEQMTKVIVTP